MRDVPRWTAFLCAAVLAGCESGLEPTAMRPTAPPLFNQGSGPVVQSATGAGHFTVAGELRTFSFTALRYADGTVQGEYELFSRLTGTRIHGDVTCLSVRGNQAWIGGRQEQSNNPTILPGGENGFNVADNGEGANSPPDQMSLMFVNGPPGFAQAYCTAMAPAPPPNPIEAGNIQVRN
jgi:hypothetical protein